MGLDAHSAELLELPAIRELLAAQTSFEGSRELALALAPTSDPAEVARLREETEEAIALGDQGVSPPGGARDVRAPVRAASTGATLDEPALVDVGDTCRAAIALRAAVLAQAELAPRLAAHLEPLEEPALAAVASAVEAAIDERGEVRDTASAELAQARRRLARARSAAAETLRQLAQRLRPHLQESFVTERAGRPVLAVKAGERGAVPGLVHDSSGSGQTLFVEPLELVEATNRVRELAAVEREEVQRVLAALSAVVAARAAALGEAADALAATDLAMARGELGRRMGGARVEPAEEVELIGARHPLLDPARAVPVDLPLRGVRALVVSGPNAGGKTVALKTLGLAALMHQCGLRVPARRARLPVFDRVLADIGDEQSIARSLSTFSAHVSSLIAILEVAGDRSLVLLDEVAGGTDPHEGAALARAVLEALMERGALVLATSHHPGLKEWASGREGALNAAVGFDPRSLRPTFELRLGEPGASHALAIAEQLGLEAEVVRRARAALGPEREAIERLLADAEGARRDAVEAAEAARAEREEAERGRLRVAAREADLAAEVDRARADAAAERARARAEAERELASAGRELAALRAEIAAARRAEEERARAVRTPGPAGDRWRRERERRLQGASDASGRAAAALAASRLAAAPRGAVAVGDQVLDPELGFRGRVLAIEAGQAEVQGPTARLRLPAERLVVDRRPTPASAAGPTALERRPEPRAAAPEIDVRGQRAEEARAVVRERVDAAAMAGLDRVRVIHGRGTGALRAAVRDELGRHPLVARAEEAPPEEGGDGATLAVLEER